MYIAKYYNISYEKFFPTIDTSYANFKGKAKNTALTSDTIANILSKYPEININNGIWYEYIGNISLGFELNTGIPIIL